MKIELQEITVKDLVEGYVDNQEEGVVGYGGRLNIRPPFQREFVYDEKERDAVIETVKKKFPLNIMYWVKNGENDFEVLDGQQRTISLCQYVNGDFSLNGLYFGNLTDDKQQEILDYTLMIYHCEGTDSEKLDWFEIVNMVGKRLTKQELRNAVYTGTWLADAKLKFSKANCAAYLLAKKYVAGSPIQQDFLETAIDWISDGKIEDYMGKHQRDKTADKLWKHFQTVIKWVQATFTNYRNAMEGVPWGGLYNQFKDDSLDAAELEERVQALMEDDDVSNKKGIYKYVLTGEERCLNIRAFTLSMKRSSYERQKGICVKCGEHFDIAEMEADHITPWHEGGPTTKENCQLLCKPCNRKKAGK